MTASGHPSNQLLQMLGVADFDLLRPHLATVEMVRESVLAEAGAALRHVYFPHGGSVSITVGLSEGQMIEVAMLGRDSAVGAGAALADGIAPTDAAVLFPGTASVLEIAAFRAVAAASAQFRGLMIRHEQALLAHAQQSVLCNTVHPVEARLARWLLRARDLSDSKFLPLTQETLAQMMGVRRNAISLVANALQRAGIIHYTRGQIAIVDDARIGDEVLRLLCGGEGLPRPPAGSPAVKIARRNRPAACRCAHNAAGAPSQPDILSQLPIYPDENMIKLIRQRAARSLRVRGLTRRRQSWKRWCAHPTVSCPHCRRRITN